MNLLAHFIAIAHYSHIAGDDSRDACLLGSIDDFLHRWDVVIVDDSIDGEIGLDTMLVAGSSNLTQIIDSKWLAEWDRMFNLPIPKYTESAPACMAAASDSREPTGAITSNSFIFVFMNAIF